MNVQEFLSRYIKIRESVTSIDEEAEAVGNLLEEKEIKSPAVKPSPFRGQKSLFGFKARKRQPPQQRPNSYAIQAIKEGADELNHRDANYDGSVDVGLTHQQHRPHERIDHLDPPSEDGKNLRKKVKAKERPNANGLRALKERIDSENSNRTQRERYGRVPDPFDEPVEPGASANQGVHFDSIRPHHTIDDTDPPEEGKSLPQSAVKMRNLQAYKLKASPFLHRKKALTAYGPNGGDLVPPAKQVGGKIKDKKNGSGQ